MTGYGSGTGERETYDGASTGGASSDSNPQRYAEADYWDERYGMDDDTFDWCVRHGARRRQADPRATWASQRVWTHCHPLTPARHPAG